MVNLITCVCMYIFIYIYIYIYVYIYIYINAHWPKLQNFKASPSSCWHCTESLTYPDEMSRCEKIWQKSFLTLHNTCVCHRRLNVWLARWKRDQSMHSYMACLEQSYNKTKTKHKTKQSKARNKANKTKQSNTHTHTHKHTHTHTQVKEAQIHNVMKLEHFHTDSWVA